MAALTTAFGVADTKGDFKMMLSLDYAGGGAFSTARAEGFIERFSAYDSYYMQDGRPLVTTFEGPTSAGDWAAIKEATNSYVVPDWSSLGAQQALDATDGVIDGLFAWSAWPVSDTFVWCCSGPHHTYPPLFSNVEYTDLCTSGETWIRTPTSTPHTSSSWKRRKVTGART